MADSNKTEQATPRRRLRAKEQGQVTRSRELSGILTMGGAVCVTVLMTQVGAAHLTVFFRTVLDYAATQQIQPNGPLLFWTSIEVLRWIVPILLASLMIALGVGFAQGGFVFAPAALAFKPDRFNPATRLGQMFSITSFSQVLKSLLPFAGILWVGIGSITLHWNAMLLSPNMGLRAFTGLVGSMIMEIGWKSGLILLIWAGVDYLFQWFKNESDLKMTRQEIKEELKESDGSPENKARIRRIQRQLRRKKMLQATETATVVVTNPTHYAVALRFEMNMEAPIVVAKGLNLLAERIKAIARERDIPTIENRPLAQALYKSVEVGDAIPSKLYHAVAEILVMVFKAQAEVRNRTARAGGNPTGKAPLL
ncbi:EscU/YscU/HrcU family type III secretion system export apparatus switch protein [Acidobacteria bacterium AB60]|nr:EscU/YscU/HrcU family type III secretion system export apparatus switch protein [Acidobacteria bacterium AB60]